MCGIAGVLGQSAALRDVNRRMLTCMRHRGPNGMADWLDPSGIVWFGHLRLSIIDLSTAASQPMASPDGRFMLVFNGEIYNYVEVRAELKALGSVFRTDSDSEVIIEAYRRFGSDCLSRLNGMFAFALYDRARGIVFCARDRFGEKPFLFSRGEGHFAFGSEYKALLALPQVSRDYDSMQLAIEACAPGAALDRGRQTVFKGIEQLLPAEAMEIEVASLTARIWRYWDIPRGVERRFADDRDALREFRDLFVDSVRLRLRSDVPVGSCLSGGLDSGAIVGAVRHLLGEGAPYNTFTGRFPDTPADEWRYASDVIAEKKTISHVVEPTVERFMEELPTFIWHNELPVGSSSQFAQWCVFNLAKRENVTVLLDGQGADEVLGGYPTYFAMYLRSLDEVGDQARRLEEEPLIRARYPAALMDRAQSFRSAMPAPLRRFLARLINRGGDLKFGLRAAVAEAASRPVGRTRAGLGYELRDALYDDSFHRFLSALLRYGDRNSMAHSREVRLPFCDHRIAEFALSLPPHLLMGGVQNKRLVREGLAEFLPVSVATRWEKQGFRPPQDLWFTSKPFLSLVRETLSSADFAASPIFEPKWWGGVLDRIEKGELALAWTVWQPFITEMWRRHFIGALDHGGVTGQTGWGGGDVGSQVQPH